MTFLNDLSEGDSLAPAIESVPANAIHLDEYAIPVVTVQRVQTTYLGRRYRYTDINNCNTESVQAVPIHTAKAPRRSASTF